MQKTFSILATTALLCFSTFAQQASPALNKKSSQAELAAALDAARLNSDLHSGNQPYHLVAHFKVFKPGTSEVDFTGDFDEFWLSPSKSRRTITTPKGVQKIYWVEGVPYTTPDSVDTNMAFVLRLNLASAPVESFRNTRLFAKFSYKHLSTATLPLDCITSAFAPTGEFPFTIPSLFCLDPAGNPRLFDEDFERITLNSLIPFGKQVIPRDIDIGNENHPFFQMHISVLTKLPPSAEADFIVPVNATETNVVLDESVASSAITRRQRPVFPPTNLNDTAVHLVVVVVTIGKDGHVLSAQIEGPAQPTWDGPAIAAAKQFVFRPFIINGQPVMVKTKFHYQTSIPMNLY